MNSNEVFPDIAHIELIDHLKILNFKSFAGEHYIGPFLNFTCIIGPNGGGKSNVAEAISFVLNVHLKNLRSSDYHELINKNSEKNGKHSANEKRIPRSQKLNGDESAFVIICFKLVDGSFLELKRSIVKGGESLYYIKGIRCQRDDYDAFLGKNKIISNVSSFLMMQADTDILVSKTPEALTDYFERISGSINFKKDYDVVKAEHDEVQAKIKEISGALSSLKTEKKKLRQALENNKEYDKLTKEIGFIETQIHLLDFFEIDSEIERNLMEYQSIKSNYDSLRGKTEDLELIQRNLEKDRANTKKAVKMLEEEFEKRKIEIRTHKQQVSNLEEELKYAQKINQTKEKRMLELQKNKEHVELQLKKFQAEKLIQENQLRVIEQALSAKSANEMLSEQNLVEYQRLEHEASLQSLPLRNNVQQFISEKRDIEIMLKSAKEDLQLKKEIFENLTNELEIQRNNLSEKQAGIQTAEEKLTNLEIEMRDLKESNKNIEEAKAVSLKKIDSLVIGLAAKKEILKQLKQESKNYELYQELRKNVKGFRGELGSLVKPIQDRFELPLKLALSGAINYLVVDNSEAANNVNQILKEKGLQKLVLVLDSIPELKEEKETASLIRTHLSDLGNYAFDTINYQKNVKGLDLALSFFLSGKVICDDIKSVSLIREKRINQIKQIITLDGTIMNNRSLFKGVGNINSVLMAGKFAKEFGEETEEEAERLESELGRERMALEELNKKEIQIKGVLSSKAKESAELSYAITKHKSDSLQIKESILDHEKGVKETNTEVRKLQDVYSKIERDKKASEEKLKNLEDKIKEDRIKIFKEFCIKLNLNSINEIRLPDFDKYKQLNTEKDQLQREIFKIESEINQLPLNSLNSTLHSLGQEVSQTNQSIEGKKQELAKQGQNLEVLENLLAHCKTQKEEAEKEAAQKQQAVKEEHRTMYKELNEIKSIEKQLANSKDEIKSNMQRKARLYEEKTMIKCVADIPLKKKLPGKASKLESIFEKLGLDFKEFFELDGRRISTRSQIQIEGPIDIDYSSLQLMGSQGKAANNQKLKKATNKKKKNEERMRIEGEDNENEDEGVSHEEVDDKSDDIEEMEEENKLFGERVNENVLEKKKRELSSQLKTKNEQLDEFSSANIWHDTGLSDKKIEETDKKLKKLESEIDELLNTEKTTFKEFESLKNQRIAKFMELFNEVNQSINRIYEVLTTSPKNPIGGKALLYLENTSVPFEGGIIYSPTPPNKRFVYNMDQLSGGEKTMASLSLMFSINLAIKSKFLLFDEADAYLDSNNASTFLRFLKGLKVDFKVQTIVISHKPLIFQDSDSLVGVTFDPRKYSSHSLSLDLRGE